MSWCKRAGWFSNSKRRLRKADCTGSLGDSDWRLCLNNCDGQFSNGDSMRLLRSGTMFVIAIAVELAGNGLAEVAILM